MADISVDVSLPSVITVDVTSPTQALAANVSIAGAQGPSGIQGPGGATGPSGAVGPSGATGPSGAVGPSGATGPSGAVGPSGATGPNGSITGINNIVYTTGNQTISGTKTFIQDTTFGDSAQGDFLVISGNNFTVYGSGNFTSGLDLNNSNLINASPQIINLSANFNISGNYNSRMIMVNSATQVTGRIVSGNSLGFNATITQVGAGKILITGSGIGIKIGSFNNQYKTAGQFATASVLHTGNNGYVMYGNTTS
jgi:hypothetical protein